MSAWSNACLGHRWSLQPPTIGAPQTFLAECAQWVIDTTDAVWRPDRSAAQINASLHEYFYEEWESTSNGKGFRGMAALEKLVWDTKRAFPDLRIHITDAFCVGNDVDGYKTIMPDVLVGTHLGPSGLFGAPTGKRATWSGMALCYVQRVRGRWQYVAEWVVHDELSTALQLGSLTNWSAASAAVAQSHDCDVNLPSWGWQPPEKLRMIAATVNTPVNRLAAAAAKAAAKATIEARVASAASDETAVQTHTVSSDLHPTPAAKV